MLSNPNIFLSVLFILNQLLILAAFQDSYDPTMSESNLYLGVNPKQSWGKQMRQQKSMRMLLLGGSNSAGCCCDKSFPVIIASNISQNSNSYILNSAIRGSQPYFFIGKTYDFESWPKTSWPNIVIIEFSLNSWAGWSNALEIDNLIYLLIEKWELAGLPPPDIVFLELFGSGDLYYTIQEGKDDTRENRIKLLNSVHLPPSDAKYTSVLFNQAQAYIDAVARYYSYPVLSVRNTWWPAFCRFYIENSVTKRWPYVSDGAHASCIGHKFIAHNIVLRFLNDQMMKIQPEEDDSNKAIKNEIRMFPRSLYSSLIENWPLWGLRAVNNTHIPAFQRIIKPANGWGFTYLDNGRHKFNDGHDCYGSRGQNNVMATFKIQVPPTCQQLCTIGISYLHSWNTSYIGDVICRLHSVESNIHKVKSNVTIRGSVHRGVAMKATFPEETRFPTTVGGGLYTVKCSKLDSKFSCFTGIAIYSK